MSTTFTGLAGTVLGVLHTIEGTSKPTSCQALLTYHNQYICTFIPLTIFTGLWRQTVRVQIPTLPFPSWTIMGKLLNFSVPNFPHL